jgi:hypothetical protein
MQLMKHLLTSTLLCSGVLLAADFWQSKKPSEWSEKEARKIFENSPWVKDIQPERNAPVIGGGMGGRNGRGGASMGGMGGGNMSADGGAMNGPMGGPMAGPEVGGMQMPKFKVAFETATPVAEAKARISIKDVFQGLRDEFVVVSVTSLRSMGAPRSGGDDPNRAKEMQARLLQMTTLKVKDDKVYQPAEAKIQQTPTGSVMLFAFPRKELQITPEDKQVTFKTTMGPMEISVKFNLKDMVFDQKLSL